jgi:hypothetical protein
MAVCAKSFENVLKFKYLRTTARNQNYIDKEIQRILNSVLPSSSQTFVFLLLSENEKIKMYRIIILLLVLYGCETTNNKHRLSVSENIVPRGVFGRKKGEVTGG